MEDVQQPEPDSGPAAVNAQDAAPAESGEQSAETKQLSYILYSNQTLPEHVSMEQRVLGFDYCTPLKGTLTSGFGYREHPVEGCEKFHYGLDIAAEEGTAVACFADGTVTAAGRAAATESTSSCSTTAAFPRCTPIAAACAPPPGAR